MTELVDLKRTKADKKAREAMYDKPCSIDGDDYPYSLTVRLDDECLKKLGISALPKTGATVRLVARAHVVSTSESSRNGRDDRSVELQLREMAVGAEDEDDAKENRKKGMRAAIDDALTED